jgi:hypothetical protein
MSGMSRFELFLSFIDLFSELFESFSLVRSGLSKSQDLIYYIGAIA